MGIQLQSVTAKCNECAGDIVVQIPATVDQFATTATCRTCRAQQRVTAVRRL